MVSRCFFILMLRTLMEQLIVQKFGKLALKDPSISSVKQKVLTVVCQNYWEKTERTLKFPPKMT